MNKTTPYETLIAAKLNEIPVPDMADAIWSGIEAQLDGVAAPQEQVRAPKAAVKGWYFFAGVFIVAVLLWWYFASRPAPQPVPPVKPVPPTETITPSADIVTTISAPEKVIVPAHPVKGKNDTIQAHDTVQTQSSIDTAAIPLLPPVKKESWHLVNGTPPIHIVDTAHHRASLPKRPKGVPGISNEDYKISTGTDSTKTPG